LVSAGVVAHTLWTSAAPAMAYRLYAEEWHLSHTATTGIFAIYPAAVVAALIGFGDIAVKTDAGKARAKPKDAWTHLRGRMEVICRFPAAITPTHLAQSGEVRSCPGAGWSRMSDADTRLAVRPRRSHMRSGSRECRDWLLFSKYAGVA
jgi:hypothetical protein